jgi:hypothetical protein
MFRYPIVKSYFFNQEMNDFCLVLTKESINKYTKTIEENNSNKNKNTKFIINSDYNIYNSNSNSNPNNTPHIIIYCMGIFSFAYIFYFFKSKK